MSSKIITTVIIAVIVGPFVYLAADSAVRIKHNLQQQTVYITQLSDRYEQLDTKLDNTINTKSEVESTIEQLEIETQNAIVERQRLEAELGAN